LLVAVVRCPRCSGEIKPTWDWCEWCGFDPDGVRPPDAPTRRPSPYASPTYTPPPFSPVHSSPNHGVYGPPAGAARAPSSGGATALAVVGGVAVAFVLLVVACIAAVTLLGRNPTARSSSAVASTAAPTSTLAPTWSPWVAPDGSFSIDLPGTPTLDAVPMPEPGTSATRASVQIAHGGVFVEWADLEPGYVFKDTTAGLNAIADGMQRSVQETFPGFTLSTRSIGTFAGNPSMTASGSSGGLHVDGLFLYSGRRLYGFVVSADGPTAEDFQTLVNSFHIR
jgi:hypothetical protein